LGCESKILLVFRQILSVFIEGGLFCKQQWILPLFLPKLRTWTLKLKKAGRRY